MCCENTCIVTSHCQGVEIHLCLRFTNSMKHIRVKSSTSMNHGKCESEIQKLQIPRGIHHVSMAKAISASPIQVTKNKKQSFYQFLDQQFLVHCSFCAPICCMPDYKFVQPWQSIYWLSLWALTQEKCWEFVSKFQVNCITMFYVIDNSHLDT